MHGFLGYGGMMFEAFGFMQDNTALQKSISATFERTALAGPTRDFLILTSSTCLPIYR